MKKYFIISLLLLTACDLTPALQKPAVTMPQQWSHAETQRRSNLKDWWWRFKNIELADLQAKALEQNIDLKTAASRIDQARAALKSASASIFPDIDFSGGASTRFARDDSNDHSYTPSANAGLDIGYELDLFGANRAARRAAAADVAASEYGRETVALVVSADVAKTYAQILALKGRISVAEQSRMAVKETLDILAARFREGAASGLELEQQKTSLSNTDAGIASLKASLETTTSALAILLGEPPQGFQVKGDTLVDLYVPKIAPGQPSDLLRRRPDIRAAEAGLVAANADIGAARAAFFPSVNLGIAPSVAFSPLTAPAATTLALSAAVAAPIFKGGSLQAEVEQNQARLNELAEGYHLTVLTSFKEVEDALITVKSAEDRQQHFASAVASATKAYAIAEARFKEGAVDYTSLLETQRSLLSAKENLITANLDRMTAAVDLYKALGGGWRDRI